MNVTRNIFFNRKLSIKLCKRCYVSLNLPALNDRGIFNNVFPEINHDIEKRIQNRKTMVYAGFDPTAESLHVGNLLPLLGLLRFQRAGIQPIVVIGGATVEVGDPSGKSSERDGMDDETVSKNVAGLQDDIERIFRNHEEFIWKNERDKLPPVKILNNIDWYKKMNVLDFVADVGKHCRMTNMLSRDSVQSRLNSPAGMSYKEFSYQIFQAYDWYHLFNEYGCYFQLGGNDQIGNMMAGFELIRRTTDESPYFFTVPIVTNEIGNKFGKSAGNAVWLSPAKLSAYEFYQFFMRLSDSEMKNYLNLFTFLPDAEIKNLLREHMDNPDVRRAQKRLAEEVTLLIHGEHGLNIAKKATEVFFHNNVESLASLDSDAIVNLFGKPFVSYLNLQPGISILDTVMKAKCFPDEKNARRVIDAGGVYVNFRKVNTPNQILISGDHILPNNVTLIRIGKKNYYVVKWNT